MTSVAFYDVAIIGHGALGLGLAYQLKKADQNLRVAVVGIQAHLHSSTLAAGPLMRAWAELPVNHLAYVPLFERAALVFAGMERWDALCAELSEFSASPLKVQWGSYVMNRAFGGTLDYLAKTMAGRKIAYEDAPDKFARRAIKIPDGCLEAPPVLMAYERALQAMDTFFLPHRAEKITPGNPFTVTLEKGENIQAGQVVLANGSFAQALVDQDKDIKIHTPRLVWGNGWGLDLEFPGKDGPELDAPLFTVDPTGFCYGMAPQGPGKFHVGITSSVSLQPETQPGQENIHALLKVLAEEVDPAFARAKASLRGPVFFPATPDGFPLLGQSHVKGLWFANGMMRSGFTASPFIAAEMAQGILGNRHQLPFWSRPSRPLLSYKTRAQAVEEIMALPQMAGKRGALENIYNRHDLGSFGIHSEMIPLYASDAAFSVIRQTFTTAFP